MSPRRLEQALLAAGERVVRVPPKMMGASRRGERERGKSDQIDAQAVARAVVKDGVDRFPVAYLDERAMEIRLLFDHREDLVRERTRMQNRLRWHLLELCPALEAKLPPARCPICASLSALTGSCDGSAPARARGSRASSSRTSAHSPARPIELESELLALVGAYRPRLLEEQGCGALTAALLIGRTAGAERFRSDACFGRQSGTAPIPCSSGKRTQHRLDRGGDRQLNRALHTIAITRAQHDPATKRVPRTQTGRGQNQEGRAAVPQALSRAPLLAAAHRAATGTRAGTGPEPSPLARTRPRPSRSRSRNARSRREVQRIAAAIPMVCIT